MPGDMPFKADGPREMLPEIPEALQWVNRHGRLRLAELRGRVVLMVFWSRGEEPDALILDELFVDAADRLIH